MREQYLPPQVTRVGSVEDLTLAAGPGGLLDICIQISTNGAMTTGAVAISDQTQCFAVS